MAPTNKYIKEVRIMHCVNCSYAKDGCSNPDSSVCEQCLKTKHYKNASAPKERYDRSDEHGDIRIDIDDE